MYRFFPPSRRLNPKERPEPAQSAAVAPAARGEHPSHWSLSTDLVGPEPSRTLPLLPVTSRSLVASDHRYANCDLVSGSGAATSRATSSSLTVYGLLLKVATLVGQARVPRSSDEDVAFPYSRQHNATSSPHPDRAHARPSQADPECRTDLVGGKSVACRSGPAPSHHHAVTNVDQKQVKITGL
jgi:hypothetical protein